MIVKTDGSFAALLFTHPVYDVHLVDGQLGVRVVSAAAEGVGEAGAVQAGLNEDEAAGEEHHARDDGGPPGGEVAELVEHRGHCPATPNLQTRSIVTPPPVAMSSTAA